MKGNIDYLISGVKMHLTYRYFPENDEFELVRGEFFDRSEIFPSALKLLETAPMHAEKIRDLIYLDLCAWGAGIAAPSMLYVQLNEETKPTPWIDLGVINEQRRVIWTDCIQRRSK